MRLLLIIISLVLLTVDCLSQGDKYFQIINTELAAKLFLEKNQSLIVNGQSITELDTFRIRTNYPYFDTIYFKRNNSLNSTIITRFHPDSIYYVLRAFGDEFDIYDSENWDLWNEARKNPEINFDSIRFKLIQGGEVQFLLTNYSGNDTIIGYYGDFAGPDPKAKILTNNVKTELVKPHKGYFVNNYNAIVFAKYIGENHKYIYIEKDNYDWPPGAEEELYIFYRINCRFFNNEKIMVTYDFGNNKTEIKILKN